MSEYTYYRLKKQEKDIEFHGPCYQAECGNCGWMSECGDTEFTARLDAADHDCVRDGQPHRLSFEQIDELPNG